MVKRYVSTSSQRVYLHIGYKAAKTNHLVGVSFTFGIFSANTPFIGLIPNGTPPIGCNFPFFVSGHNKVSCKFSFVSMILLIKRKSLYMRSDANDALFSLKGKENIVQNSVQQHSSKEWEMVKWFTIKRFTIQVEITEKLHPIGIFATPVYMMQI